MSTIHAVKNTGQSRDHSSDGIGETGPSQTALERIRRTPGLEQVLEKLPSITEGFRSSLRQRASDQSDDSQTEGKFQKKDKSGEADMNEPEDELDKDESDHKPADSSPARPDSEYSVGSFNTYSAREDESGGGGLDHLKDYAGKLDIVGFQETGGSAGASVTGAMAESGKNGYVPDDNSNPIYWDKDKFDLVHGESLLFHEPDERGPGVHDDSDTSDQTRTSTLVVLRDKTTGNEVLVSNTHTDVDYDDRKLGASRLAQLNQVTKRQEELSREFSGIQATVSVGDYNQEDTGAIGEDASIHNQSLVDHILISGENDGKVEDKGSDNQASPENGDDYPHEPMVQTFSLDGEQSQSEHDDAKDDDIVHDNGRGAVFYDDTSFGRKEGADRDAWTIGFGSEDHNQNDWNDKVTSVITSDGVEVELHESTGKNDEDELEFSGESVKIEGNARNVGEDMNDKASGYSVSYE